MIRGYMLTMFLVCLFLIAGESLKFARSFYTLSEFGPLESAEQAKSTFHKAIEALRSKPAVLLVPAGVSGWLKIENTYQRLTRIPPLSQVTKSWRKGPGLTIIEADEKNLSVLVPQMTGLRINRTIRMPHKESLPHWDRSPVLRIESALVHGSNATSTGFRNPLKRGRIDASTCRPSGVSDQVSSSISTVSGDPAEVCTAPMSNP